MGKPKRELSLDDIQEILALRDKLPAAEVKKRFGIGTTRLYKIWRDESAEPSGGGSLEPEQAGPQSLLPSRAAAPTLENFYDRLGRLESRVEQATGLLVEALAQLAQRDDPASKLLDDLQEEIEETAEEVQEARDEQTETRMDLRTVGGNGEDGRNMDIHLNRRAGRLEGGRPHLEPMHARSFGLARHACRERQWRDAAAGRATIGCRARQTRKRKPGEPPLYGVGGRAYRGRDGKKVEGVGSWRALRCGVLRDRVVLLARRGRGGLDGGRCLRNRQVGQAVFSLLRRGQIGCTKALSVVAGRSHTNANIYIHTPTPKDPIAMGDIGGKRGWGLQLACCGGQQGDARESSASKPPSAKKQRATFSVGSSPGRSKTPTTTAPPPEAGKGVSRRPTEVCMQARSRDPLGDNTGAHRQRHSRKVVGVEAWGALRRGVSRGSIVLRPPVGLWLCSRLRLWGLLRGNR